MILTKDCWWWYLQQGLVIHRRDSFPFSIEVSKPSISSCIRHCCKSMSRTGFIGLGCQVFSFKYSAKWANVLGSQIYRGPEGSTITVYKFCLGILFTEAQYHLTWLEPSGGSSFASSWGFVLKRARSGPGCSLAQRDCTERVGNGGPSRSFLPWDPLSRLIQPLIINQKRVILSIKNELEGSFMTVES